MLGKAIEREYNLFDLLRRPGVGYAELMGMGESRWAPVAKAGDFFQTIIATAGDRIVSASMKERAIRHFYNLDQKS